MKKHPLRTFWFWHSLCCLLALVSCVIILWPQVYLPDAWEQRIISYAGVALLGSLGGSLLLLGLTTVAQLLHLHYRKALVQALGWGAQWALCAGVFVALAWLANVPVPKPGVAEAEPIQPADTPALAPNDMLTGPAALFMVIPHELFSAMDVAKVASAPHLTTLEEKHSALLESYLSRSPRWALYMDDDTFYSKPGHMVMTPEGSGSGIQGLVHVAFRHLAEGAPIPSGYTVVKPGDPMPTHPEGNEQVDDLAVDLGLNHYLLLAWRGTSHTETAYRALNAALTTVDDMVRPLAEQPTQSTLQYLLTGKRSLMADTPTMLLSQPPAQYGTYQAELYVNPGEPGTLLLRIADAESNAPLRIFHCPAQYSDNPAELFRHDIPDSTRSNASLLHDIRGLLPEKAPLFAIKPGEAHQFFDVVFELWFQPAAPLKQRRMLLRRIYRVQAYEKPTTDTVDSTEAPQENADKPRQEPES